MDISFKNADDYFYNGVHPSGYKVSREPDNQFSDWHAYSDEEDVSKDQKRVFKILPIVPNEPLKKKKISLIDLFMDIESLIKKHPNRSEENTNFMDDLIMNVVDKYGFLRGSAGFLSDIAKKNYEFNRDYESFMQGKKMGILSIDLNDENFNSFFAEEEKSELWLKLLNLEFDNKGGWSQSLHDENSFLQYSIPIRSMSHKISLEPLCLGAAYLFFRYSKNITGVGRCDFCEKSFADTSRSNNQRFCSEKCRVSNYRENQIRIYKKEINAKNLFIEHEGQYRPVEFTFNDVIKNQIRRTCLKHGEFSTKVDLLQNDPGCPKCKKTQN